MPTVLITGSSGYLGSRLLPVLAADHEVISLSRRPPAEPGRLVQGDFTDQGVLARLDDTRIDAVLHLASVVGGCSEQDAMDVNVSGTWNLMRWAVDHRVQRFVLASSIAAVGCLSRDFVPREMPIPDDYPCEAVDAYGLSKAMVEDIGGYFWRQSPDLDITLVRIGSVLLEDAPPITDDMVAALPFPFAGAGSIAVDDAIRALATMVRSPAGPGCRRVNMVADRIRSSMPTGEFVQRLFGSRAAGIDLSHYARAGHEHDSVYSTSRITELFGFRPATDPATLRKMSSA